MTGYVNIAEELVDSMTEIILELWGPYEGSEVDETREGAREAAADSVAKHGIFATQYFIEVYRTVS